RFVDVHYVGQFHDLTVPVAPRGGAIHLDAVRRAFEREHRRTYGYVSPEEDCEIRAARLVVRFPKGAARPEGALVLPDFAGTQGGQVMRNFAGRDVYDKLEEVVAAPHTALLVVDMQNDFCSPEGVFGKRGADTSPVRAIIPGIRRLLETARSAKTRCIFLRHT